MDFYETINNRYPKIFEFVFSKFLNRLIKKDFIPHNYLFFRDSKNINEWGKEYFDYFELKDYDFANSFIDDNELSHITVFKFYAGYFFHQINGLLRDGKSDKETYQYIVKHIELIKQELEKMPLKEDLIVIRRVNNSFLKELLKGERICIGTIIPDKAFLSTSLDLSYRKDNESKDKPLNNETLMLIKINKGANAIYLEPISKREEFELLLPCNSEIVVEKKISILNNRILLGRIQSM